MVCHTTHQDIHIWLCFSSQERCIAHCVINQDTQSCVRGQENTQRNVIFSYRKHKIANPFVSLKLYIAS